METFNNFSFPKFELVEKTKVNFSYQQLGLEMQNYFPIKDRPRLWSLFYKFDEKKIENAFNICQKKFKEKEDEKFKSLNYLIGIIKKL